MQGGEGEEAKSIRRPRGSRERAREGEEMRARELPLSRKMSPMMNSWHEQKEMPPTPRERAPIPPRLFLMQT